MEFHYKNSMKMFIEKFDNKLFNLSEFYNPLSKYKNFFQYELVVVLTVWKRNNLDRQLMQVKRQSILKEKKTNIIIFQNSNHTDINDIIKKWKQPDKFNENVKLTIIKSPIETGYFGRFISPLTASITSDTYFIICDDDVIWGDRYF